MYDARKISFSASVPSLPSLTSFMAISYSHNCLSAFCILIQELFPKPISSSSQVLPTISSLLPSTFLGLFGFSSFTKSSSHIYLENTFIKII